MTESCDVDAVSLLRYRYPDGGLQAVLPMWTVERTPGLLVGWTPPGTQIMYWALPDGSDPRTLPLDERFAQDLTTAPRTWAGTGVLRVIPRDRSYQVLHFWDDDGSFAGWYVNLESVKTDVDDVWESVDWHLDLQIGPDLTPSWKDADEADAAVRHGWLGRGDLEQAWRTGSGVLSDLAAWPAPIGDWRDFRPSPGWGPLSLPPGLG